MNADDIRARFLRDRVLTATPAQRVVMLYDRLVLDLTLAQAAATGEGPEHAAPHLSHAMLVVAELQSSLDVGAGGPAENLFSIYGYLLRELIDARGGARTGVADLVTLVTGLRESWAAAVASLSAPAAEAVPAAAGAWVG